MSWSTRLTTPVRANATAPRAPPSTSCLSRGPPAKLIAKLDREGERSGGPTRAELIAIRDDERAHVELLAEMITELGGEPALVSPAATRAAIVLRGVGDVIDDPASGIADGLEAIVMLELADHEQWVCLVELARELRRDDLARTFLTAQANEHTHVSKMRAWVSAERAFHRALIQ